MQNRQFAADFGDAKVDVAHPVADEFGDAWWYITYENDAKIEITESVADGYRLVDVECRWAPDEETVQRLPVKRDSNSVSWTAVVGTVGYHDFWCAFVNVVEGPTALPTLPPTDAATRSAVVRQDAWRLVLVCLAGVLGAVLVIGSRRSTQARRSVQA